MTPTPPDPKAAEPPLQQIDLTKRYDVYCAEMGQRIVVYRNAQFKSIQRLISTQKFGMMSDFYELVQADRQSIFIMMHSVVKFCEHGIEPIIEVVATK